MSGTWCWSTIDRGSASSRHRTIGHRTGPTGTPQQIHLDLWVDDPTAAHDLVMSLGAEVLKEAKEGSSPDSFQVHADPAGHPFCLCWVKPRKH
jgi:Glyoxalase-like domain